MGSPGIPAAPEMPNSAIVGLTRGFNGEEQASDLG